MSDRIRIFEQKIEEYFLSCYPSSMTSMPDKSWLAEWPLYKFSIVRLYAALSVKLKNEALSSSLEEKLIDIKLHFAYVLTVVQHFDRGTTLIVGNNEIEKLNPRTLSLLRAIHYRVYLLSVLAEQILDLMWLVVEGRPSNHKKGKWEKILKRVQEETGDAIVTQEDMSLMLQFKSHYRTAELHKYSTIRGLTGKSKWTHLQDEEQALSRILGGVFEYYVQPI